jgi:hypothetical protein
MPINRGPYNALVDDDGSNTVGTNWSKDDVKDVLLDPIDAALGNWVDVAFNAADYSSATGTWVPNAASLATYRYRIADRMVYVQFDITGGAHTITGAPSTLYVTMPSAVPVSQKALSVPSIYWQASGFGTGLMQIQSGTRRMEFLRDINGTAWANSAGAGLFLRSTFFYSTA